MHGLLSLDELQTFGVIESAANTTAFRRFILQVYFIVSSNQPIIRLLSNRQTTGFGTHLQNFRFIHSSIYINVPIFYLFIIIVSKINL